MESFTGGEELATSTTRYRGFMVMPFSNESATQMYKYSIKGLCDELGIDLIRADEIFDINPIAEDIIREITQAAVVIVDISDNNPNVFYELGLAHAVKRDVTVVITGSTIEQVPFDVKHLRIIRYENTLPGKAKFDETLRKTLTTILKRPAFYEPEIKMISNLVRLEPGLVFTLAFGVLLLKAHPLRLDQMAQVLHARGEQFGAGTYIAPELAENGHLAAFGLIAVQNDTVFLTRKGEALADYWLQQGYVLQEVTLGPIDWRVIYGPDDDRTDQDR